MLTETIQGPDLSGNVGAPDPAPRPAPRSSLGIRLLLGLLGSLRSIVIVVVLGCVLVGSWLLLAPRTFVATAQLATISPNRTAGASASIAAALGGLQNAGVQATPALIVQLSRSNAVLANVGTTRVREAGNRRLVDLIAHREPGDDVGDERVPEKVRSILDMSADNQSGLIRFSATHRDSAVARRTLIRLVEEVNKAYLNASQAQARAIADAQAGRVDSAATRLALAESRALEYARSNRQSQPYSFPALERTRLERERDFAQTLYVQAVSDRDAAVGRALEQTPALIVVDPVPAKLKPQSRGVVVKLILTGLVILSLAVVWVLGRIELQRLSASAVPEERRLARLFSARKHARADS
jgi:hypothetical protein